MILNALSVSRDASTFFDTSTQIGEVKIELAIFFSQNILFYTVEKKARNIFEDRHSSNLKLVIKI